MKLKDKTKTMPNVHHILTKTTAVVDYKFQEKLCVVLSATYVSNTTDLSGLGEPSCLFSKLVMGVTAWMADWFSRMATA